MQEKYPRSLFWTVFLTNFFAKHVYLALPGFTLLIVGIWTRPCLWIGLGLLVLDACLSLTQALHTRKAFLTSDDPNFQPFRDAVLSENWRQNIDNLVREKQSDGETEKAESVTENVADLNDRFNRARYMDQDGK